MLPRIKQFLAAALFCASLQVNAQDSIPGPRKEFYVSLSDFSPLNVALRYKKQMRPKTYLRLGLVNISAKAGSQNANVGTQFPVSQQSYSGGLEIGIERRKSITKKLVVFHGPAIQGTAQYNVNWNSDPSLPPNRQKSRYSSFTAAVPYCIGFLFQLHSNFYVAAELNPSVYVNYQQNINIFKGRNINGGFQFDSRNAIISFVYRY